jgi:hypothetical protein
VGYLSHGGESFPFRSVQFSKLIDQEAELDTQPIFFHHDQPIPAWDTYRMAVSLPFFDLSVSIA